MDVKILYFVVEYHAYGVSDIVTAVGVTKMIKHDSCPHSTPQIWKLVVIAWARSRLEPRSHFPPHFLSCSCSSLPLSPWAFIPPSSCDLCPSWQHCKIRSQSPTPCGGQQALQACPRPQNPLPSSPGMEQSTGTESSAHPGPWPVVQPPPPPAPAMPLRRRSRGRYLPTPSFLRKSSGRLGGRRLYLHGPLLLPELHLVAGWIPAVRHGVRLASQNFAGGLCSLVSTLSGRTRLPPCAWSRRLQTPPISSAPSSRPRGDAASWLAAPASGRMGLEAKYGREETDKALGLLWRETVPRDWERPERCVKREGSPALLTPNPGTYEPRAGPHLRGPDSRLVLSASFRLLV